MSITELPYQHGTGVAVVGRTLFVAGEIAVRITGAADEEPAFAEFTSQLLAAFWAVFVDEFRGGAGNAGVAFFRHLLAEVLPEIFQHRLPLDFAIGNVVELVFQIGGEVVVDPVGEMLGEEFVHYPAHVGGCEALLVEQHILAGQQGLNNAGISRGSAYTVFFKRLHQARFRVAGRWLREMLLTIELVDRQLLVFLQHRQFAFALFLRVVLVFVIDRIKARKNHGLAGGAEEVLFAADGDIHGNRIELGGRHLAGDGALPDHFVKASLVLVHVAAQALRRARDRCRPNGLVRFLRVLRFVDVLDRLAGQVVFAVLLADVGAGVGKRLVGQAYRIGTHIRDETDGAIADVDAFIQILRDFHGAVGGKAQLAHRFLL